MAWIYDMTKTTLINSRQILSVNFENVGSDFEIKAIVSAGTGKGSYGAYDGPITYILYRNSFQSIIDEKEQVILSQKMKHIQSEITDLEQKLVEEMNTKNEKINLKIPELRNKIDTLKEELLQLEIRSSPHSPPQINVISNRKKQNEKEIPHEYTKPIIQNFIRCISDPEFHTSNEIIDFTKIL